MKKILITSALPYVNNIPHLGNLIQVLSADVFARFCRLCGYETLYICGTDEYGTATETRALEEGISPQELCDRYHKIHAEIYQWFQISFDFFGRTSTPLHTEITQHIFWALDKNGYISEKSIKQLYCEKDKHFLADRYVDGTCPHCSYESARGDQCENCGKLLDPTDLINPRCHLCQTTPVLKPTRHLYLDLPKLQPLLKNWMGKASQEGKWANNAIKVTEAWLRDGLHERCITRDLKWGIPVPKPGFAEKVFYVWFDAPIGYISITANLTDNWQEWWRKPEEVELYQFIGKDNIPFHTVIFPSALLGTGETWTLLKHMSSTEYLNYESGKFSKSKGIGVFGNDAQASGIPADVWRFYMYYNRPEKNDTTFSWNDFKEKVNSELLGNFANLVNRTLSFIHRFYEGRLPKAKGDPIFWEQVTDYKRRITEQLEETELRTAFRLIFELSSLGNKRFQDEEPWRTVNSEPDKASSLLYDLVYLVRDLAIMLAPYLPQTAERILGFLNIKQASWAMLSRLEGIDQVNKPELLFSRLQDKQIEELRLKFAGEQKKEGSSEAKEDSLDSSVLWGHYREKILLKAAKIISIEKHPKAEKLYIEKIDLGEGSERTIVSGLVPYYQEEELLGKMVVVVANLAPAKLRGIESQGMLLAAEAEGTVEVLFVPDAKPGDRIFLEGDTELSAITEQIDIETFLNIPLEVKNYQVQCAGINLVYSNGILRTEKVKEGSIG